MKLWIYLYTRNRMRSGKKRSSNSSSNSNGKTIGLFNISLSKQLGCVQLRIICGGARCVVFVLYTVGAHISRFLRTESMLLTFIISSRPFFFLVRPLNSWEKREREKSTDIFGTGAHMDDKSKFLFVYHKCTSTVWTGMDLLGSEWGAARLYDDFHHQRSVHHHPIDLCSTYWLTPVHVRSVQTDECRFVECVCVCATDCAPCMFLCHVEPLEINNNTRANIAGPVAVQWIPIRQLFCYYRLCSKGNIFSDRRHRPKTINLVIRKSDTRTNARRLIRPIILENEINFFSVHIPWPSEHQ